MGPTRAVVMYSTVPGILTLYFLVGRPLASDCGLRHMFRLLRSGLGAVYDALNQTHVGASVRSPYIKWY